MLRIPPFSRERFPALPSLPFPSRSSRRRWSRAGPATGPRASTPRTGLKQHFASSQQGVYYKSRFPATIKRYLSVFFLCREALRRHHRSGCGGAGPPPAAGPGSRQAAPQPLGGSRRAASSRLLPPSFLPCPALPCPARQRVLPAPPRPSPLRDGVNNPPEGKGETATSGLGQW